MFSSRNGCGKRRIVVEAMVEVAEDGIATIGRRQKFSVPLLLVCDDECSNKCFLVIHARAKLPIGSATRPTRGAGANRVATDGFAAAHEPTLHGGSKNHQRTSCRTPLENT